MMEIDCGLDRVDQALRHVFVIVESNANRHRDADLADDFLEFELQILPYPRSCINRVACIKETVCGIANLMYRSGLG